MDDLTIGELDDTYMKNFEILETKYNKFYNQSVNKIKLFFIYINEDNEIYSIKTGNENIDKSCITKERILYLIKNNQYNLLNKHKLVSLLKFNIDLHHTNLNSFILNKTDENYLSSLKILDTIKFNDTIPLLSDLNSLFFIYNYLSKTNNSHNTTKRIMITEKSNKSKTRRK
tara:strand:+ start:571 stop:1086 length:516 start_codon:yes stop_codon:yes gene_type:complete